MLEALPAFAQLRGGLEALGEAGDPRLELTPGLVVGIGGHRPAAAGAGGCTAGRRPAGRPRRAPSGGPRPRTAREAPRGGRRGSGRRWTPPVEQLGVLAFRDDDPQGPPGQRGHLDGVDGPGQFGGEHALDILIAQRLGHRDHQVRGVPGEAGGVGRLGQPGGQPGHEAGGPDPFGQNIGVEEVLLHELAEGGGELVLALDDQRGVRYRQAQRVAEQGRHREPVGHAADHGRLGPGLHVAEEGPVDTGRRHGQEQHRHRGEEGGGPPARGGQAARPLRHRLALEPRYR